MSVISPHRRSDRVLERCLVAALLLFAGACGDAEYTGPSAGPAARSPAPAVAAPPGIVFASFALSPSQLNTVHTGIVGPTSPSAVLGYLSQVKSKGGRVILKLSGGDANMKNADNTFNLTKWKQSIDRYRTINLDPYINDGTIVAHFLVDEPHFPSRWGGQVIPQATVEQIAAYSKARWPTLPTVVNAPAHWLAGVSVTYVHLDAAWSIYRASASSNPTQWARNQVDKAKLKGLGLVGGLNVLDGGDGSSGFHGNYPSTWAMSASELRTYGTALLSQAHVCAFGIWRYQSAYYGRPDVKAALADLAASARSHAKTSCRQ